MSLSVRRFYTELEKIKNGEEFLVSENVKEDDPTRFLVLRKLAALNEIKNDIEMFGWVRGKESTMKIKKLIEHKFDYKKTAEKLKVTPNSIQVTINRYNKKLEPNLSLALDMILKEDKPEEGLRLYQVGLTKEPKVVEKEKPILLDDFLNKIGEPENLEVFSLIEFRKSINLLKIYSHKTMDEHISSTNKEQLPFLRYILEGKDSDYDYLRSLLFAYIRGDKTLDDLIGEYERDMEKYKNVIKSK